ncbi:MAG: S9 family peptidase [Alphaproteobacteria bacterium]|nr:S9 family peptidase [Alphaproteobacteria bacterium]
MAHIHPDVKISPEIEVISPVRGSVEKAIEAAVVSPVARQVAELVQLSEVPLLERSKSVDVPIDPKSLDAPSALAGKSPEEIKAIMNAKGILSRGDFDKVGLYRKAVSLCDSGKMYAVYDYKEAVISFYKTDTKAFVNKVSLTLQDGFYIEDLVDLSHEHNHPLKDNYLLMQAQKKNRMYWSEIDQRYDQNMYSFFIYNLKDKTIRDLTPTVVLQEVQKSIAVHKESITNCYILCSVPDYLDQSSQERRNTFVFTMLLQLSNKFSGDILEQKTFVCSYNLETQTSEIIHTLPFFALHIALTKDDQIEFYLKTTYEEVDYDQAAVMIEACEVREGHPEVIWRGLELDIDSMTYNKDDPNSPYLVEADLNGDKNEPVLRSLRSNQTISLLSELEKQKLKSNIKEFEFNPKDPKELVMYETSYDEPTLHVRLPNESFEAIKASMIYESLLFKDPDFLTHLVQKLDIKEPYIADFSTRMLHQFFLLLPATESSPVKFELIYSKHVLEDLEPEIRAKCSAPQSFTFKARDGLELQGYLTLPANKEAKNLPALLLIHGGPAKRDKLLIYNEQQAWASRGFAVVQINFRGSNGFGKKFEEAGYDDRNGKMTDDLIDGLNHWIQEGVIDPAKIVAYGGSYGAFAVTSCLTRYPDFFTCGIAVNGSYDLTQEVNALESEKERVHYAKRYDVSIADDNSVSEHDLEKLRQSSPHYALDQLTKPLLIISGAADDTCDPEQSHALAERAHELGKSVLHVEFDDAGHSYDSVKSDAGQLSALEFGLCENFVSRYLPEIFAEPVSADFAKEKTAHIIRSTL